MFQLPRNISKSSVGQLLFKMIYSNSKFLTSFLNWKWRNIITANISTEIYNIFNYNATESVIAFYLTNFYICVESLWLVLVVLHLSVFHFLYLILKISIDTRRSINNALSFTASNQTSEICSHRLTMYSMKNHRAFIVQHSRKDYSSITCHRDMV